MAFDAPATEPGWSQLSALVFTSVLVAATLTAAIWLAVSDTRGRNVRQRVALDASIDRIIAERQAARTDPETAKFEQASADDSIASVTPATASSDEAKDLLHKERERDAKLGRDTSLALMKSRRRSQYSSFRPDRAIANGVQSVKRLTFSVFR